MRSSVARLVLFLGVFSVILSGCVSMSSMQTARITDKNEFVWGLGASSVKSTFSVGDEEVKINAPLLEIVGRYGISDRIDIGAKLGLIGTFSLDGKYQFLGTSASKFAGSFGMSLGYLSLKVNEVSSRLYDVSVPLIFSYHPADWLGVYASPKYNLRLSAVQGGSSAYSNWYGATGGLRLGKKVAFVLEYSWVKSDVYSKPLAQITAGVVFGIK